METFEKIYQNLLKRSARGETVENNMEDLDCLFQPQNYPVVWKREECDCPPGRQQACRNVCEFDAIRPNEKGGIEIAAEECVGCGACIEACDRGKLEGSRDAIAVLNALKEKKGPAYALIAPAFTGQLGPDVTPGKLRTAFKKVGFDGMIEVALFADILTLKEALEFDRNIQKESDYQLTSCCCPMWIAMIRKVYHELMPHVPGAVSPIVACGRTVKSLYPDALTVFIGPCLAKKSEAREKDVAGAVDYVLTFQEAKDILEAMDIETSALPEDDKDHSSRAGRIYARKGGVSEAVKATVDRLNPEREITVRTRQADGVPACKEMLSALCAGKADANFFEGMGCAGGCVGGPKAIIKKERGTEYVDEYGERANYPTPIDNPYVIELLHRLGFDTVESLLEHSDIFTRDFE